MNLKISSFFIIFLIYEFSGASITASPLTGSPRQFIFNTRAAKQIKTKKPPIVIPACVKGFKIDTESNATVCLGDSSGTERSADEVKRRPLNHSN
jgi:hypothetical protein